LHKQGMMVFPGHMEVCRNRSIRSSVVLLPFQLINQIFPKLSHFFEQSWWQEARRLADAKSHLSSAMLFKPAQQPLIFLSRELFVECSAKRRTHESCSNHLGADLRSLRSSEARLRLDQKLPIPHDLSFVNPDIKPPPNHVNVG